MKNLACRILLCMFTIMVLSPFAEAQGVVIKPKLPVDCAEEARADSYVHSISDVEYSFIKDKIQIEIDWQIGKCKTVISGNGHAAKFINTLQVYRPAGNSDEIIGLAVKTKKSDDRKYSRSIIVMDKKALENGRYFKLYFTYGAYLAQAVWSMEIIPVGDKHVEVRFLRD